MPTLRFEIISGNWKPFKGDWKNVFCFTVKALFALKIFKSLTWLFYSCRKMAHKKAKFNFKIYDVINREMSNYNHVLSDISRCKGNQKMKYGQLIGYSDIDIFFSRNHIQNVVEKLVPDPFLKQKSTVWNFIQFVFIVCQSRGLPKCIETEV